MTANPPQDAAGTDRKAKAKKSASSKFSKPPYLKDKNAAQLWIFLGANLAVFFALFVSGDFSSAAIDDFWKRVTAKDGILAAIIPLLAVVVTGVFSDTWKARLVFWRWRNPLPGCRVFTDLLSTEPRLNEPALAGKVGKYPEAPNEQNALWFKIYKKHSEKTRILESHKIYLLTRDMAAVSTLIAFLFPAGVYTQHQNWQVAAIYAAALLLQFVLIAASARNYGNRFVLNVLVEESHV